MRPAARARGRGAIRCPAPLPAARPNQARRLNPARGGRRACDRGRERPSAQQQAGGTAPRPPAAARADPDAREAACVIMPARGRGAIRSPAPLPAAEPTSRSRRGGRRACDRAGRERPSARRCLLRSLPVARRPPSRPSLAGSVRLSRPLRGGAAARRARSESVHPRGGAALCAGAVASWWTAPRPAGCWRADPGVRPAARMTMPARGRAGAVVIMGRPPTWWASGIGRNRIGGAKRVSRY